jgi:two-component system chemotaxis response regulator CheB
MASQPDAPVPWFIGIAASAGGVEALRTILKSLPADLPAAIAVVLHRPPGHVGHLLEVLGRSSPFPVHLAAQGQAIEQGRLYLAPSDSHLTVMPERRFLSRDGSRICFVRSSANPLFASVATVFGRRAIGVVLSGGGSDATDGVQSVKAGGGIVIVQDPAQASHGGMPAAAIRTGAVDYVLPTTAIGQALNDIVHGRPVS